ncbi:MAG: PcfJ domain-containing protein [Cetobacterium sp.]
MKVIKEKGVLYFSDENRGDAKFSLIDGSMAVKKNNKWESRISLATYFSRMRVSEIDSWFDSDDKNIVKLIRAIKSGRDNCKSINTFLKYMKDFQELEKLYTFGLNIVGGMTDYEVGSLDIKEWNKGVIKHLKDSNVVIYASDLLQFQDDNVKKAILAMQSMNLHIDEYFYNFITSRYRNYTKTNASKLLELSNKYQYDLKSLLRYLNYVSEYENVSYSDAINFIKDYYFQKNRMSKINKGIPDEEIKFDKSIEKYPKYLRSVHDIVSKQFSIFKQTYDEDVFNGRYENVDYTYSDNTFCVVRPNETNDLKLEGMNLNHCVKSYIGRIIDGKCIILFVRYKKSSDESLITIEIRDNAVVQIKGLNNRNPDELEYKFIKKYCKNKNLQLNVDIK